MLVSENYSKSDLTLTPHVYGGFTLTVKTWGGDHLGYYLCVELSFLLCLSLGLLLGLVLGWCLRKRLPLQQ